MFIKIFNIFCLLVSCIFVNLGSSFAVPAVIAMVHVLSFYGFWFGRPADFVISPFYLFCGASAFYCYTAYIFALFFDLGHIVGVNSGFLPNSLTIINIYFGSIVSCVLMFHGHFENAIRSVRHDVKISTFYHKGFVGASLNIFIIFSYFAIFVQSGGVAFIGDFSISRSLAAETLNIGKVWLLKYLILGTSISVIFHITRNHFIERRNPSSIMVISSLVTILYFLLQLSLGNRREFISIVLAALASISVAGGRIRRRYIVFALSVLFAFLGSVAVLRDTSSGGDYLIASANAVGEFIYPWFTFQFEVQSGDRPTGDPVWITSGMRYVASVMNGTPYFSAAQLFAMNVHYASDYAMGYAYTPVTEAYKALGVPGAIIAGPAILLTILLSLKSPGRFAFFMILSAEALDINRSEFFSMLIQFLIVTLGFYLGMIRPVSIKSYNSS